jgi:hypothetical protein
MIDTSRQLAPAPKRLERRILKDQHDDGIRAIHDRAAEVIPADYLICHQSDPDRGHKIRAQAKRRIAIRNAKRLKLSRS